ncbi:MAG: VWA domain-containing protein [Chloracidobacterium sp.]|nr:VWA domain-containing protein [Chloracidobacterium sp.]
MLFSGKRFPLILFVIFAFTLGNFAQDLTRDLNVREGGTVEIVNRFGRVAAKAEAATDEKAAVGRLNASLPKGVAESAIKIKGGAGHIIISVEPADKQKRIDLTLVLPERTKIKVETLDGAVEVAGNFASVDVKTYVGTIAVDVPDDDLKYQFLWTESKPRYLADFEIAEVKEKAAGRFEVKGRRSGEVQSPKNESEISNLKSEKSLKKDQKLKAKDQRSVSLNFTTARGIILLNVPPSEVMSDLRERPLTNAAKAIIRSGDSLLMEAIRRASPKYFGDYARTLPPIERQPSLSNKSGRAEAVIAPVKTALVRVTDINNRAIAGLSAKDFEVLENGKEREIISVERSTAPFNLVLLLDVSGSVENYVNFIRKAARSFVDTVDKNDRISIVTFNDDVKVISKFTTDKGKLSESLDTFDAGGGTAYYDALAYTIADTLRQLKGERTAIVILTDGDDNRSFLPFDALLGSIQESGSLIYPLYVPSGLIAAAVANPTANIDPMRSKYMSLTAKSTGEGERLAKVSGGVYYPITQISQIQLAYEDIVVQLRTAYNIAFRSGTAVANGVSPRLKIRAKRDNTFSTINSVIAVK